MELPGARQDLRLGGPSLADAYQAQFTQWGQRFGWPVHLCAAMLYMLGAAGPIATVECFGIPLFLVMIIRIHATGSLVREIFQSRFVWLIFGLMSWGFITIAWSSDAASGVREVGNSRWLWSVLAVTSVMHRRAWLVAALFVSVTLGLVAQGLEAIGLRYGIDALVWPHPHNPLEHTRISGWWHHPVMGGTVLVGALGMFLPCAIFGSGWRRGLGLLGVSAVLAGIFATGTRGAWIAALALVLFMLMLAVFRMPRLRAIQTLSVAAIFAMGATVGLYIARGEAIKARWDSAVSEVTDAVTSKNYNSDTGARIQFALRGLRMITERPLTGYGAGGYQHRAHEMIVEDGLDPATTRNAPGAHNGPIHLWATLGLPGLVLMGSLVVTAIFGGIRLAKAHAPQGVDWIGTFGAAPSFGLIGLLFMMPFEGVYTNVQPAAFATALVALCAHGCYRFKSKSVSDS